jgi:hypothetical protein
LWKKSMMLVQRIAGPPRFVCFQRAVPRPNQHDFALVRNQPFAGGLKRSDYTATSARLPPLSEKAAVFAVERVNQGSSAFSARTED